jgi:hypothetical protein
MKYRFLLIFFLAASVFFMSAPLANAATTGTYQVVAGDNDNAYLVNTETGAVWILTYRTLATGREPIAIPYRFLKIKPDDHTFLFEEYKGPSAVGPKSISEDKND